MVIPALPTKFFGNRDGDVYAIQARLSDLGFSPGRIDGLWGARTQAAFDAFKMQNNSRAAKVSKLEKSSRTLLTAREAISIFGEPGASMDAGLVAFTPPYEMRLEWDPSVKLRVIRAHPLIAKQLELALLGIKLSYSAEDLTRLGLRNFSGTYSHRKVTGGIIWSKHAFGIAIDLFAAENAYSTPYKESAFARKEYTAVHEAFALQGFINLGKVIGRDTMHFEITRNAAREIQKSKGQREIKERLKRD